MTTLPIIFSAAMVRALLDGRKTQTRRLAWRGPFGPASPEAKRAKIGAEVAMDDAGDIWFPTPWQKVGPGDLLWVREAHYVQSAGYVDGRGRSILYRATEPDAPCTWTSPRYMPRWASRLTLRVTAVKVEKLQAISEADAKAEGVGIGTAIERFHSVVAGIRGDAVSRMRRRRSAFAELWDDLHGAGAWKANPDVVAISFDVEWRNVDA